MRKILLLAVGIFAMAAVSAQAQQKIAYIDIKVVIRDSKGGKEAHTSFQKEVDAKRQILEQKRKVLDDLKQDFLKNNAVMSESKRKTMAESMERKQKDLDRTTEDIRLELQRKDLELTQSVLEDIEAIVIDIGNKEGFDVVMEKSEAGILFGSKAADITRKVISAYDASQ